MVIRHNPRGRGARAAEARRDQPGGVITVRPLAAERLEIEQAAARTGQSLATYLLERGLRAARRENRRADG